MIFRQENAGYAVNRSHIRLLFLHGEFAAEIHLPGIFVVDQIIAVAGTEDLAAGHQICAVHTGESFADIVVGDQDPEIFVLELPDDFLHFLDGDRIDAAERFIQQNE